MKSISIGKAWRLLLASFALAAALTACRQDADGQDDGNNGSDDGAVPQIVRMA